jgi:uroporphyrin-3 C-methyltransferase
VLEQGRAWVQWWLAQAWQSTRELVRVSRIDSPDAVLLAPEQSFLLRENLKLRLLNARLALLSRQVPSARADLQAVETSLRKYFDVQSPEVKQAMGLLSDTLAATKVVVLPQPEETLTALSAAAGGR